MAQISLENVKGDLSNLGGNNWNILGEMNGNCIL
jgi:hypothetical protein